MDLRRKLSRISAARAKDAPPPDGEAVFEALRAQLQRRRGRIARGTISEGATLLHDGTPWPFPPTDSRHGMLYRAVARLEADARHGSVPVQRALAARSSSLSTLALDATLADVDPSRVLFVDTETTGLAGGTGTIPFLVGMAFFDEGHLVVEQLFVDEPGCEATLLAHFAERVASASALVSFNGKSFDLPLLRSRCVLARVALPALPPHLDLLHVARRIYGARVERCTLGSLERDVLRFERVGDVPGEEIPERYRRYLVRGDRAGILPVVQHNVWDLVALAALVGELAARVERAPAEGRTDARDHLGLARTSLRAGDTRAALAHAGDAVAAGAADVAREAHLLAAAAHVKTGNADARRTRLLAALAHTPADPAVHLELARCYERELGDPHAALVHAGHAGGAERPDALARRIARLTKRCKRGVQLRLPGF